MLLSVRLSSSSTLTLFTRRSNYSAFALNTSQPCSNTSAAVTNQRKDNENTTRANSSLPVFPYPPHNSGGNLGTIFGCIISAMLILFAVYITIRYLIIRQSNPEPTSLIDLLGLEETDEEHERRAPRVDGKEKKKPFLISLPFRMKLSKNGRQRYGKYRCRGCLLTHPPGDEKEQDGVYGHCRAKYPELLRNLNRVEKQFGTPLSQPGLEVHERDEEHEESQHDEDESEEEVRFSLPQYSNEQDYSLYVWDDGKEIPDVLMPCALGGFRKSMLKMQMERAEDYAKHEQKMQEIEEMMQRPRAEHVDRPPQARIRDV
jgi:hypothetical protein